MGDVNSTLFMLVITLLTLLTSMAVWRLICKWRSVQRLPPGPWGLPWLGYLTFINAQAPYETLVKLSRKYGRVYSVQLGGVLTVVVSDAKLIRQAFSQDAFSGRAPLYLTHGIMKGYGNRRR